MDVRFSSVAGEMGGPQNPLYRLVEDYRRQQRPIIDLVRGNVNEHGMVFPIDRLARILETSAAKAAIYRPDSFGQPEARAAISNYYGDLKILPNRIVLTPGTSVSYWYCFKLLADPGDEILPQPSYPLFDYIARLCGVQLTHYRLDESRGWAIDLDHLEARVTTRTRAIVVISPHNPTGMVASPAQLRDLAAIAARHGLPIISDEVFSEFLFGLDRLPRPAETPAPLVITLNGFSKMYALPGIKIGWMALSGGDTEVRKAMAALEMISDTFLPVNEIAQFAVPEIFAQGTDFLNRYRHWVTQCREAAVAAAGNACIPPQGGFYVTLAIVDDEEATAISLLRDRGILVHPGYYYDIKPNHLVATFIHDPNTIATAFRIIASLRN